MYVRDVIVYVAMLNYADAVGDGGNVTNADVADVVEAFAVRLSFSNDDRDHLVIRRKQTQRITYQLEEATKLRATGGGLCLHIKRE